MREVSLIVNCPSNALRRYERSLVRKTAYKAQHTICITPEDKLNRYIGYNMDIKRIMSRVCLNMCKVG